MSKKILEKTWVKNLNKEKMNYLEKLLNKSNEKSSSFNLDSKRKMRKILLPIQVIQQYIIQQILNHLKFRLHMKI